ncbi:hypothetical protein Emed_002740 [Eimeria media]
MVNKPRTAIGLFLILSLLFVFESSLCAFLTQDRGLPLNSSFPLQEACSLSLRRCASRLREVPFHPSSSLSRQNSTFSFCPSYHTNTATHGVSTANRSAARSAAAKRLALTKVYSAVQEADRKGASGAHGVAGPVTDTPAGADADLRWDTVPITRLRTAARNLQLSTKGTRAEIRKRLEESASTEKVLAVLRSIEGPEKTSETHEDQKKASENISNAAQKPKAMRCHVCNSRLSAKARFCSKCGATISLMGQETLRDFVEKAFWPVRQDPEQEVGSNTMRVESGFWQSILEVIGDVPVANLSAAVWEEYLRRAFRRYWGTGVCTVERLHQEGHRLKPMKYQLVWQVDVHSALLVLKKRNCSPRTQALHQVAYLAALKYAVHTRRLDAVHPFRKIRGCTKRTLSSVPLTADEVYLLLAATPNTMHCAMFAVGIGAGLRPSELLSMRWEDVNMEEMTATIRGSKTAASAAAIPLTNLAGRELMRWWEEEGRPTSGSFKKALQAAAKRAGIDETRCGEPRRIFPYILRHSFATIAATSNPPVPLPVAQAVMRHTSSKMLLETYAKAGALVIKEGLRNFKI